MLGAFFAQAMRSPGRQTAFRKAVTLHTAALAALAALAATAAGPSPPVFAQFLLVAGVVEGAMLVGWRLAQLPKSQALEFLLVSPVRPRRVFLAEALIGLGRLALVTLAGLPILVLLLFTGRVVPSDLPVLVVSPFLWGAVTGLGLTAWAYEPRGVRRWGEMVGVVGIVVYLVVGVLAVEKLGEWMKQAPDGLAGLCLDGLRAVHTYNPFAVVQNWFDPRADAEIALGRVLGVSAAGAAAVVGLTLRAASRLKGHFHERHYRAVRSDRPADLAGIGERPLTWWAVRRVMEYSGRLNLWLAGGFGLIYAAYTVAGAHWPPWMSTQVFRMVDATLGLPALATGLVLLAAVPAAFQYGLWDPTASDRCRRLELLLLTELTGIDYARAAVAAAWRRGRGYFSVAVALWLAAVVAGRAAPLQALAALSAGVILWGLWFALGFRAFGRGRQANGLGSFLTIGLPLAVFGLVQVGWPAIAAVLPPGAVFTALAGEPSLAWLPGPLLAGGLALGVTRSAIMRCDADLRRWYDQNTGRKDVG
jgi:hypothetical protein